MLSTSAKDDITRCKPRAHNPRSKVTYMLKITPQFVDALPVATTTMRPKPFPGRCPTRVCIAFPGGEFYIGKPSLQLGVRIAGLRKLQNFDMVEFDRAAKFFGFTNNQLCGCADYFHLYHPNVALDFTTQTRIQWFGLPYRTLQIKGHCFYTTFSPTADSGLLEYVKTQLFPLPKLGPAAPALTSAAPRRSDFYDYTEYRAAMSKWKVANTKYFEWLQQSKETDAF